MPHALRSWGRRALPTLPPLTRRTRWALVAIVAVGLVLRVAWAVQMQEPQELRDPVLYMILADNLAAGDGYRYGFEADQGLTAYYPPGYPLVLGGLLWLVGLAPGDVSTFDVAVWTNVALSVATIGLVFVLGRRLVGPRVGLVAAGIWALWPNLVFHTGIVLTETLFLFLLVLMLVVALGDRAASRAPGVARLVAVGLSFGAVLLVRPVSAVVAPVFLVLWWGNGARAALWRVAVVGLATVAVLLPWSIRSTAVMDEPVVLSLNFGDNLCLGHNPGATGGFGDLGAHCYTADELSRPESETRRQSENIDRALTYITENPGTTLRRTPSKLRITLQDDWDGLQAAEDFGARPLFSDTTRGLLRGVATGFYALVGLVGIVGAVLWLRRSGRDRRALFLIVAGLVQLVPPLATFGDPRFKMPIYPTVAVCAAVALVALWDRRMPGETPVPDTEAPADGGAAGDADAAPGVR
ncbi:MAG TPA: glycosyltransferase family 39 protein, partial [Acidimicrobiales bacterium]|nr:glycosyltransferase family 39 protein [Acidimicrobiales bacterium]